MADALATLNIGLSTTTECFSAYDQVLKLSSKDFTLLITEKHHTHFAHFNDIIVSS